MTLTKEQQKKVEANMGLVGKVIKDKVYDTNRSGIYTFDDLYQIGCIGLCKAAATDKGGQFSTYAYRLIWNEICDALIYANRRSETEIPVDYDAIARNAGENTAGEVESALSLLSTEDPFQSTELKSVLAEAQAKAVPTVQKGIHALLLMADGYTAREIGEQYGVAPNIVTAWVSKARKYLKEKLGDTQAAAYGGGV